MKTVLIADDDPSMIHILTHILESQGLKVHSENNGTSALETAQRIKPDLLILDLMMPYLDGLGVLTRLYGEDPPFTSPAILLTAQDSMEYRDLAESFDAVKFVEKPFELDQFIKIVQETLESASDTNDVEN